MSSGIVLQDCYKAYTLDLEKARAPRDTLNWVQRRLKTVDLEILAEAVRIDQGRLDIPVYISRCGRDAAQLLRRGGQMGKGSSPDQAEASAVMELVERFSLYQYIKDARFLLRPRQALTREAMSLETLARSVEDTSDDVARLEPFFETLPLVWVWARNLTRARDVLVPVDWFFHIHETNGSSAGNSLEETILQAICEVVERHVTSEIDHLRSITPAIALDSLKDDTARGLVEKFQRAGITLFIRDFSLNIGIPTIGVLAHDPTTYPTQSELVFTAGTTPHPEKSLIRALTEVAQLAGDFLVRTRYHPAVYRHESLDEVRHITAQTPTVPIRTLPDISHENIREEIDCAVRAIAEKGLEVFVIDVTHADLLIPAVYTIVPGAHFRDRTRRNGVLFHLARLASLQPDPATAIERTRGLLELFPDRYETAFFLGYALERAEAPNEALAWFQRALEEGAGEFYRTAVHLHLAWCHKALGRHDEAMKLLERGIDGADLHAEGLKESYQLLGLCRHELNDRVGAMMALNQARALE